MKVPELSSTEESTRNTSSSISTALSSNEENGQTLGNQEKAPEDINSFFSQLILLTINLNTSDRVKKLGEPFESINALDPSFLESLGFLSNEKKNT